MNFVSLRAAQILKRPGAFALQVMKAFRANQGLLLAGAVAYYTLLSIVPLLILMVIALSHVIDQAELLVCLTQQQDTRIRRDLTAGKIRMDFATAQTGKRQATCATLCYRDGPGEGTRFGVVTSSCTNT